MVSMPKAYMIVSGEGEGDYPLVAFDAALRNAGIGDFNLVKVSSILPPGCQLKECVDLEHGSIVYAAYATATVSMECDMTLAVAVAVPVNKQENGVIFEISSEEGNAEMIVSEMCKVAMKNRNREIEEIKSSSICVKGKKDTYVCGISAVIMW